jgi:hypothetical protein
MRSRVALSVAALACNAIVPGIYSYEAYMSEITVKQVRISFSGPETLPLPVVRRGSPKYDGPRNFFTVSLRNDSATKRTLPLPELRENVVMKYQNPATGAEIVDNETPPPDFEGAVEDLAPGETKTFQVVFEYPERIATFKDRVAVLRFCVKWESDWLRRSAYAPGAYDWNESFELCREIRITDK